MGECTYRTATYLIMYGCKEKQNEEVFDSCTVMTADVHILLIRFIAEADWEAALY